MDLLPICYGGGERGREENGMGARDSSPPPPLAWMEGLREAAQGQGHLGLTYWDGLVENGLGRRLLGHWPVTRPQLV